MERNVIESIGVAMAEGRWPEVLDRVARNVSTHVPAVGQLDGVDELARFLVETSAKSEDGEHFELLDTLVGERFAALYFRITAGRVGRAPLDNLTLHLARFDDEQIVEIWFHNFDGPAVAEFWA